MARNWPDGRFLCVVNFLPRQIGKHISEVLTLGVPDDQGNVVLVGPERNVLLGRSIALSVTMLNDEATRAFHHPSPGGAAETGRGLGLG